MVAAANEMMRTAAGCCSGSKKNFGTRCQKGVGASSGERQELSPFWVVGGLAGAVARAAADRVAGGFEADTLVHSAAAIAKGCTFGWRRPAVRTQGYAETGDTVTDTACY